jgi:flagellar hook-associated protein 3
MSLGSIYNNLNTALYTQTKEMMRLQEQVSTGSRINRVSDDPSTAYQVLSLNSESRSLDNYTNNIASVGDILNASSGSIDYMKTSLANVSSKIISTIGGASGTTQDVGAAGINNALEEMVSYANQDYNGQYLFGGSNTSSAPYVVQRNTDGEITSVTYQGSDENRDVEVAPGVNTTVFYSGNSIFCSNNRSTPTFSGETGAKAGSGTSNVTGDVNLSVTYNDATGKYELSIDGGKSKTVVEGDDITNLAVTDSQTGKVLYVDATGINKAGNEWVCVPGTYDIFNMLINLRDKLATGGLSSNEMEELRNNATGALDEINKLLVNKSVSIGSQMGSLDNLKQSLGNIKANTDDRTTTLQQADIAQLSVDLCRSEALYQMSLSVAAKIMSVSLLDFLP